MLYSKIKITHDEHDLREGDVIPSDQVPTGVLHETGAYPDHTLVLGVELYEDDPGELPSIHALRTPDASFSFFDPELMDEIRAHIAEFTTAEPLPEGNTWLAGVLMIIEKRLMARGDVNHTIRDARIMSVSLHTDGNGLPGTSINLVDPSGKPGDPFTTQEMVAAMADAYDDVQRLRVELRGARRRLTGLVDQARTAGWDGESIADSLTRRATDHDLAH